MKPTEKSPGVQNFLNRLLGDVREDSIKEERCVKPPIGCGKPITGFSDTESLKEYRISGLCQKCQDEFFNE